MAKIRMSRAWLVTLEHLDKPAEVISVFKTQCSADTVREYMEQYYVDHFYSLQEKLVYAVSRKENPYPATFEMLPDGIRWQGRITCGHNPFLRGRIVANLQVIFTDGNEHLTWTELPLPQVP